jgi:hypothetical protein
MNTPVFVRGVSLLLSAVLLLGVCQGGAPLHGMPLGDGLLSRITGALDFWKDPCTWDGFATGAGLVLCLSWSIGGCVAAVSSAARAWKLDNCF